VPAAGETGAAGAAAWLVAVGVAGLQAEGAGAEEPQIEVVEADLPEAEPDLPEAELDVPGADAGGPGVEEGLLGVDAAAPGAEAGGPGAEADTPRAEPGMPGAEAGFPAAEAGEGQAGFVSAVDGVRGLAGIALAFDAVSWLARAELAKPGLAKPAPVSSRARAAAASADVLSGSVAPPPGLPDASDVAVPGVTTASGAPAPRGFAGTSGLPLAGPSACGGTAAFGIVTSDRLLSGAFVKDARVGVPDPDDEPAPLASAASAARPDFAPVELLSDSASAVVDFLAVLSSSAAAPTASSACCAPGSAWLSTRPPVNSLATTLSAASRGRALTARSPTIVPPSQTPQLAE